MRSLLAGNGEPRHQHPGDRQRGGRAGTRRIQQMERTLALLDLEILKQFSIATDGLRAHARATFDEILLSKVGNEPL